MWLPIIWGIAKYVGVMLAAQFAIRAIARHSLGRVSMTDPISGRTTYRVSTGARPISPVLIGSLKRTAYSPTAVELIGRKAFRIYREGDRTKVIGVWWKRP